MMKQFISVTATFDEDGNIIPRRINWEDGRKFDIERVSDTRFSKPPGSGSVGIRYTCHIKDQIKFLFFEENRWFLNNEKEEKAGGKRRQ